MKIILMLIMISILLLMNFLRDAGGGIFHMASSLLVGVGLGLAAKRFARLRQLYFSRFGTVAHNSPSRLEIAAKSVRIN